MDVSGLLRYVGAMAEPTTNVGDSLPTSSSNQPLITAEIGLAVLAVLAFITGVTKEWILDPAGSAFSDLPSAAKAAISIGLVVASIVAIALSRRRHRETIESARRVIDQQANQQTSSTLGLGDN